jgi:hypothetical protein
VPCRVLVAGLAIHVVLGPLLGPAREGDGVREQRRPAEGEDAVEVGALGAALVGDDRLEPRRIRCDAALADRAEGFHCGPDDDRPRGILK